MALEKKAIVSLPTEEAPRGRRFLGRGRAVQAPFPYVEADGLHLFADSEETWKELLSDLSAAKNSILIETFIFVDGAAARAVTKILVERAHAGVDVRLHVDGYGSLPLSKESEAMLVSAGVQVRRFNDPVSHLGALLDASRFHRRSHRRIIVVDGRVGWVGGLGVDDRWWPSPRRMPTRDAMLRFGGALAKQLEQAFLHLWNNPNGVMSSDPIADARLGQARVVPNHPLLARRFRSVLYRRMLASKKRIWLATPYFIPSRRLRRVLRLAAGQGVDVRLFLPGSRYHDHPLVRMAAHRHYMRLLDAGVRIFEFQPTFLHGKIGLFDEDWTVIGSANLDRLSLFHNHELLVESKDQDLASDVLEEFFQIVEESKEIHFESWAKRPILGKIVEQVCGWFDRLF